jgi:hypothetical protein
MGIKSYYEEYFEGIYAQCPEYRNAIALRVYA